MRAEKILVGGQDIGLCGKQGCKVIADSGTSLITGNYKHLQQNSPYR